LSQVVKKIKPIFEEKVSPLVDFFYKLNITPNILTISGVILVILGSYFIYKERFLVAGLFILIGNICDALDGSLARRHNQATKFGAFLDSVVDRISDFIPFVALAFLFRENEIMLFLTIISIIFSFLVSYTRARAEGLGIECKIGILERPERSAILIVSLFANAVEVGIFLIVLGTFITTIQRILCVYRKSR